MGEISLGSFTTQNGRTTVSSGLASGLDSSALIDSILASRQLTVDNDKVQITTNESKITAINELNTLLERFKTSVDFLRAQPGVNNETNDYFKYTTASSVSSTTIAASTYIDVQSSAGATLSNYAIDDITIAKEHILRKDNFTSDSASVVGNTSITDNYQASLGTVSGSVLNASAPITFANDIQADGTASKAYLDVIFGSENQFDATDNITFGSTTITFGGSGGNDIDISSATTLDQNIDSIVTRLNAITTGNEANTNYTYTRPSTGVLRIERDTAGTIATVGTDLSVSANFSTGTTDTTQTIAFGKIYKNNGSAAGSVYKTNGTTSASVSQNGVPGVDASTKATINVVFGAQNEFDAGDTLTIGSTTITFATSGGDVGDTLDISGDASLLDKLRHVVQHLNDKTTGDEAGYKFETNGTDTIIITRDVYGDNTAVGTNLALDADFSNTNSTQTVQFGSGTAANNPAAAVLNVEGTEGVNSTSITDAKTTHTTTLSGAITLNTLAPVFNNGSSTTDTYTPNSITFRAVVGGETYTSRAIELDGGDINGTGSGLNGLGDRIASGTVITFVKDSQTDSTEGTQDVTFQLVVGDEVTIADQSAATTYQQTTIHNWLNSTNTITITQSPTVPEFRAGTFNLGGVDITLASGDNLQVIKSKINAVTATSGVVADIIKVDDNDYSLILKASTTGVENRIFEFGDSDLVDAGDPPSNTIQIGADNITFTRQQNASDASLDIDGLTVTRATNTFSDAIDKVTFSLKSDSPSGTTITTTIDANTTTVQNGITDFLTAYNEIKFFVARQSERDSDNNLVETAVLGDESILRDVLRTIDTEINRTVSGLSSGALNTLFSSGIDFVDFPGDSTTPAVNNVFVLDETTFNSLASSRYEELRNVFTFNFTSNSSELSVFSRTNDISLSNFTLDIDTSRATSDIVRVLDSSGTFLFNADIELPTNNIGQTVLTSGGTITGKAGTALEGLVLVYTGDGTDSISTTATQGIADRLYNAVENLLLDTGRVQNEINNLTNQNTRIQENITEEEERISIERELLIARFSQLEAFIASANSTIRFFESQRAALQGNN